MTPHRFSINIKPGERSIVGGKSYIALIPHSILEGDYSKGSQHGRFLVEYPENGLKKEWVSIKDLEERGVIKIIEDGEVLITGPEGKENTLEMPKKLLHALLMSHFYLAGYAAGAPVWVLFREIEDIRIDGDAVIVTYEEEK
ncbi:unnamed protein product [marine sediment metagenome]|uniref:Uncharacterized protein n=1 Tax=marine sediment metagenome TaxID=412755 RepID=X1KUG3_9ZZZZ